MSRTETIWVTKGKVGDLLVSGHKFPIWTSNFTDRLNFEIKIYCKVELEFLLMGYLIERGFNARYLYADKTAFYLIGRRERIREELESLARDKLADVNFNKFDDFLLKVDKYFIVKRMEEA